MAALLELSSSFFGHDVCPLLQEFADLLCLSLHAMALGMRLS